ILAGPAGIAISIVCLGTLIAGLVNIFFKLKVAGVSTVQALSMDWKLAYVAFDTYIAGRVNRALGYIFTNFGKLMSYVNESVGQDFQNLGAHFKQVGDGLAKGFEEAKGPIDAKLAEIGSSAASAFTFGFSDVLK